MISSLKPRSKAVQTRGMVTYGKFNGIRSIQAFDASKELKKKLKASIVEHIEHEAATRKPLQLSRHSQDQLLPQMCTQNESNNAVMRTQNGPEGTPPPEVTALRYSALKNTCSRRSISSICCSLGSSGSTLISTVGSFGKIALRRHEFMMSVVDYKDDAAIERPSQGPEERMPAGMKNLSAVSSKKRKA
jgi:hypothetical protein